MVQRSGKRKNCWKSMVELLEDSLSGSTDFRVHGGGRAQHIVFDKSEISGGGEGRHQPA